jgi:hypothetical protein
MSGPHAISVGIFAQYQPDYAKRGIATFPCSTETKKPLVKNWRKMGPRAATALAHKFTDANALGFVTGHRNGITVLDVDIPDQRVLEDAVARHGEPKVVVRTASGKFHAWYRFNGECRRIRPWPEHEIDILGEGGFTMAPPSAYRSGQYQLIHGTLDDLGRLSPMVGVEKALSGHADNGSSVEQRVPIEGQRNNELWRHCMKQAHHCDRPDDLVDVARTYNMQMQQPLDDAEVIKTARSAWGYAERGQNRFGQHGAWFPLDEVSAFPPHHPDAFFLLAFLRAHNGPWAHFMCANGLAEVFGWQRKRLALARTQLIELHYIKHVRQAGRGVPALYRWNQQSKKDGRI